MSVTLAQHLAKSAFNLWLTAGIFFLFMGAFVLYVRAEKEIDRANEHRRQSFVLADELRQSSDDLTRTVRSYVVTGNSHFKLQYQEILDIRDGKVSRPLGYNNVYWDLVGPDNVRPRPGGQAIPLLELMRQAGFTASEFAKLEKAKDASDALTRTEFTAMALIESRISSTGATRSKAIQMLYDKAYYEAKHGIMQPIGEFIEMVDQRTLTQVRAAESQADQIRILFVLLGASLVWLLWRTLNALKLEKRQKEEGELRYRTVADFTADWEFWILPDGSFRYVSPSCEQVCGYSADEFYAHPELITQIIHPDDLSRYANHTHPISALGMPEPLEFRIRRKDGEIRWVSHICRPVVDSAGNPLGYRASNRDDTKRKQAEVEILRSNAELEQFSYAISHDMRQPLRMISSYMQMLESRLSDQLDAESHQFFDFAIDGAKRMDAMMLGLLEYSRVGREGEPPTWTESRALLDQALLFLQPAIAEAQADVRIQGEWPRVLVSPDEMVRLVQNLVGNALKFRVAGRTPEVTVTSETTDNEWRMSVSDNGVGIIPDQIGRLFQVFQRLQSRARFEGTGVGLALCRKIAEHHGGRIWADSAGEGQGSAFCVSLPQGQLKERG